MSFEKNIKKQEKITETGHRLFFSLSSLLLLLCISLSFALISCSDPLEPSDKVMARLSTGEEVNLRNDLACQEELGVKTACWEPVGFWVFIFRFLMCLVFVGIGIGWLVDEYSYSSIFVKILAGTLALFLLYLSFTWILSSDRSTIDLEKEEVIIQKMAFFNAFPITETTIPFGRLEGFYESYSDGENGEYVHAQVLYIDEKGKMRNKELFQIEMRSGDREEKVMGVLLRRFAELSEVQYVDQPASHNSCSCRMVRGNPAPTGQHWWWMLGVFGVLSFVRARKNIKE